MPLVAQQYSFDSNDRYSFIPFVIIFSHFALLLLVFYQKPKELGDNYFKYQLEKRDFAYNAYAAEIRKSMK